jgi:aspartyl protease family protein
MFITLKAMLLISKTILIICLLSFSSIIFAIEDIAIMGLIKDKVILRIDGVHFTIKKDEPPIRGVQLIEIQKNRKTVTLKIDNEIKKYRLGHGTDTAISTVKLASDSSGVYKATGKINNKRVNYIVDTGATLVSLNSVVATELGIDYKNTSKIAQSETANGLIDVYIVKLNSVELGDIKINNVEAAVHEGNFPTMVLLGMSFLKQLKMEREGDILSLQLK